MACATPPSPPCPLGLLLGRTASVFDGSWRCTSSTRGARAETPRLGAPVRSCEAATGRKTTQKVLGRRRFPGSRTAPERTSPVAMGERTYVCKLAAGIFGARRKGPTRSAHLGACLLSRRGRTGVDIKGFVRTSPGVERRSSLPVAVTKEEYAPPSALSQALSSSGERTYSRVGIHRCIQRTVQALALTIPKATAATHHSSFPPRRRQPHTERRQRRLLPPAPTRPHARAVPHRT
ncbi:hypothetical protein BC628DRAFT_1202177 [Trametes gibbosa]|nr:hypothetical protein BC628DRAFT_1202177 [Trametes gibbosa]